MSFHLTSDSYRNDFSVNKENHTITVKRQFAAELPLVWDAYTKSEILDQWWAPKPWKARTKTMDFREGGHWHYAMVGPEGQEHWAWADYKNIEVQKKFTGLDAFADAQGNINKSLPQSVWEVSFTDQSELTRWTYIFRMTTWRNWKPRSKWALKKGLPGPWKVWTSS